MYESENAHNDIDNIKQKNKLRCLYKGYMSDFAILVSLIIFSFYIYHINVSNRKEGTSTYSHLVSNFPNNKISTTIFVIEAIYLLFSAYTSFVHKVHKYSTGPQFLLYGLMIVISLFQLKKTENKNVGMSPLLVLPITIAMFFHNIPESYRNRKC